MNDDFDREFRNTRRIFNIIFTIALMVIVATFVFYGVMAFVMITDPGALGRMVGEIINGFLETVK